ncbi:hypothetical protein [Kineococcus sp. R86509]|uniref:hypothetical protein n=1 Tax=Kineococcus sp. R86509 TaxID=3093851 RepID=UPI0036D3DC57
MALTWAAAADKHGIAHEDAVHAMLNALYVETDFDEPRPPADIRPTLYIGPQRDRTAPLLEVMVEPRPPRDLHVFHVMLARRKHLSRMQ